MQPLAIASHGSSGAGTAPVPRKLLQAAHQFEALLLDSLLGPMEKAFASVPGEKIVPGQDDYQYLGTQALASSMAASGGLGIAAMIVRNLMKHIKIRQSGSDGEPAKVLPSVDR